MSVSTPTITDPDSLDLANIVTETTLAQQRAINPQWADEVEITTRFVTKTIFSANHKPVTRLHSQRPVRTIQYGVLDAGFADASRRYNDELLRGLCRFIEPVWPDVMRLPALSSGATVSAAVSGEGNFTDRRFVTGQIALIIQWGSKTQFEYVEVTGVTDSLISFVATANEYSDPIIIPCMVADRNTRSNMQFRTGAIAQNQVARVEVVDEYSLPAFATPGTVPAGVQSHDSIPIFDPEHDWGSALDIRIERPANTTALGLDNFVDYKTLNILRSWSIRIRTDDRSDAADIQRFIESRGGSTYPFWLLEPTEDLVFYQGGNNTLVVGPSQTFEPDRENSGFESIDFKVRDYVYWINPADGTVYIRKILSAIKNIGAWFLVLDGDPLPLSSDLTSRVGFASRCRFQNEYTESWNTNIHGDILVRCDEIEEASDLDVIDFSPQTGSEFDIEWEANFCSEVASSECLSVYKCGECCWGNSGSMIISMSLTLRQCLDSGTNETTGSRTITVVGAAPAYPDDPDAIGVVRDFGSGTLSPGNQVAEGVITISSTGDYSTTGDGTYECSFDATFNGCTTPDIWRIWLFQGTVTGGTWDLILLGETFTFDFDATAEDIQTAVALIFPSLDFRVTGGPFIEEDFLFYIWGEDLGSGDLNVDDANLTGTSIWLTDTYESSGTTYDYNAIQVTATELGGGQSMSGSLDDRGAGTYVLTYASQNYPFDSASVSCSGGSGYGADGGCDDSDIIRSMSVTIV